MVSALSRQEEERRRREEEMLIRQREKEEMIRRQREENFRMGYMDPVSFLKWVFWLEEIVLMQYVMIGYLVPKITPALI